MKDLPNRPEVRLFPFGLGSVLTRGLRQALHLKACLVRAHSARQTWLIIIALFLGAQASAACLGQDPKADLKVGIRISPPFVYTEEIRGLRGLSVDLWKSISEDLEPGKYFDAYEFVECPLKDQIEALSNGDLDVVISPLTITAERLTNFEFTHQYLSSGLTVARTTSGAIHFETAAKILKDAAFHDNATVAIAYFVFGNLVLAAIIWALWRNSKNAIPGSNIISRSILYFYEASVRTLGFVRVTDKFNTLKGRILEVVMIIVGLALSTIVVGVVTSALVGSLGGMSDLTKRDLEGRRIATLADSTGAIFVESLPGRSGSCVPSDLATGEDMCLTYASWVDTAQALVDGDVDVVIGDWIQLSYLERNAELDMDIRVQGTTFFSEPYGWGFSPERNELRAAVDLQLLERTRSEAWRGLVQEYIGQGSISSQ